MGRHILSRRILAKADLMMPLLRSLDVSWGCGSTEMPGLTVLGQARKAKSRLMKGVNDQVLKAAVIYPTKP
jgi:hypothetical protein